MAIPIAEKLLERAATGERLTAPERRHCVAFLMGTQAQYTNAVMGEMFQVSERQIRLDKKSVKSERIALLKEEDIGLVVADILLTFERQMQDIEAGKKKCRIGSRDYLDHCKTLHAMQLSTVKALQELGHYPKNLGNMTVEKYEYKATVDVDMTKAIRPLDMVFDTTAETQDAEFEPAELRQIAAAEPEPEDDAT